jgi:hypothetical protein
VEVDTVVILQMGRKFLTAALFAALLLVPAGIARADTTDTIIADCVDGQLDGSYSRGEIQKAQDKIPSDIDEYSDCRGALQAGRLDGSNGSNGSGASGNTPAGPNATPANPTGVAPESADPQNPTESTAVTEATRRGSSAVSFGSGGKITPGATGLPVDDRRSVPNPLLVALILLTTAALLGAVLAARARVISRRLG